MLLVTLKHGIPNRRIQLIITLAQTYANDRIETIIILLPLCNVLQVKLFQLNIAVFRQLSLVGAI